MLPSAASPSNLTPSIPLSLRSRCAFFRPLPSSFFTGSSTLQWTFARRVHQSPPWLLADHVRCTRRRAASGELDRQPQSNRRRRSLYCRTFAVIACRPAPKLSLEPVPAGREAPRLSGPRSSLPEAKRPGHAFAGAKGNRPCPDRHTTRAALESFLSLGSAVPHRTRCHRPGAHRGNRCLFGSVRYSCSAWFTWRTCSAR